MATVRSANYLSASVLLAISVYRKLVSPFLPAACRFTPTCSQYAADAIRRYGAWRGIALAAKRVAKCHPLHPGGHDPVG